MSPDATSHEHGRLHAFFFDAEVDRDFALTAAISPLGRGSRGIVYDGVPGLPFI